MSGTRATTRSGERAGGTPRSVALHWIALRYGARDALPCWTHCRLTRSLGAAVAGCSLPQPHVPSPHPGRLERRTPHPNPDPGLPPPSTPRCPPQRYDILTFSRPAHPLAFLGYPVVRALQGRFRRDSARSVARAAALGTVDRCMDAKTRARLEAAEDWEAD